MDMSELTAQQRRTATVLRRLATLVEEDDIMAEALVHDLDKLLDDIHGQDGFGTEGQCDPRGDFREDGWSMAFVEGVG